MALPRLDREGSGRVASPDRMATGTPSRKQQPSHLAPLPGRSLAAEPSGATSMFGLTHRTGVSSVSLSPARGATLRSSASSKVDCGPRKPTQAQLAERLHTQLLEVLRTEWKRIRSTNLGVLSGTAVVEDLLLRRIQACAAELHTLAITHATAAERLGELCRGMAPKELQQMQVMLDQTGHSELSDFVRIMVFNTSDPSAKEVVGDLSQLRAATAGRRARSSSTSRKQLASRAPPPRPVNRFANDPDALRFAGILPDGHRLVEAAHETAARRRQEEEARREAAAARAARARAKALAAAEAAEAAERGAAREEEEEAESRRMAADAVSVLHNQSHRPPELRPYWEADVEAQWRASVHTRLPEEGLFCSALMLGEPLPAYEVPPDVVRMRVEAEEAAAAAAARALLQSSTLHGSVAGRSAPPTPSRGGAGAGSASPAPWERGSGGQGVSRFASRAAGAGADSSAPGSSQGPRVQLHHSATQGHGGSGSAGGVGIGIGAGGSGGPSRFARGAAGGSVGGGAGGAGTTEAGGQQPEDGQVVVLQAPPIMRRGGSGQQATPVTASGA